MGHAQSRDSAAFRAPSWRRMVSIFNHHPCPPHLLDRLGALRGYRPRTLAQQVNGEAFAPRVECRGQDTDVERQAGEPQAVDTVAAEMGGEAGVVEGGVLVLVESGALGDDDRVRRQAQMRMKGGARSVLNAVRRPRAVVRVEARMWRRVPVARRVDRQARRFGRGDPGVQRRNNRVSLADRQRSTGAKVVLHVDDQQRIARFQGAF